MSKKPPRDLARPSRRRTLLWRLIPRCHRRARRSANANGARSERERNRAKHRINGGPHAILFRAPAQPKIARRPNEQVLIRRCHVDVPRPNETAVSPVFSRQRPSPAQYSRADGSGYQQIRLGDYDRRLEVRWQATDNSPFRYTIVDLPDPHELTGTACPRPPCGRMAPRFIAEPQRAGRPHCPSCPM